MKKECTHDYAIAVFKFYGECGCPTNSQLYEMLRREAECSHDDLAQRNKRRKQRLLTEEDLIEERIKELRQELKSLIEDIEAVNGMLEEIEISPSGKDKLKCISYIYFSSGVNLKTRGNMSALIQKCVMDTGMNESFIYRSLRQAREIFAQKRGIGNTDSELSIKVFGTAIDKG